MEDNFKINSLIVEGCRLEMTCAACPEQYDVYFEGSQLGYLRLRHGIFTAEYPDCGGYIVYDASPEGDGVFMQHERFKYLKAAVKALVKYHNEEVLSFHYRQF